MLSQDLENLMRLFWPHRGADLLITPRALDDVLCTVADLVEQARELERHVVPAAARLAAGATPEGANVVSFRPRACKAPPLGWGGAA